MSLLNTDYNYIGRFAPSPTGVLHFGSLVTAVASYCLAKHVGGQWLLRIEDLDAPRVVAGTADQIMHQLEVFCLHWDGTVMYQSQRSGRYQEVVEYLYDQHLVYPCGCSRRQIADSALSVGCDGPVYPGTCRPHPHLKVDNGTVQEVAWRFKTVDEIISFKDAVQGVVAQNTFLEVGDFILQRRDGSFAYQLAVVVDDYDSGVTHIVRGRDLLSSTVRQICLATQLGFSQPQYAHIPLALNMSGEKISKRHHQVAVVNVGTSIAVVSELLYQALIFLGQQPPADLLRETPEFMLAWAVANFNVATIPAQDQQVSI